LTQCVIYGSTRCGRRVFREQLPSKHMCVIKDERSMNSGSGAAPVKRVTRIPTPSRRAARRPRTRAAAEICYDVKTRNGIFTVLDVVQMCSAPLWPSGVGGRRPPHFCYRTGHHRSPQFLAPHTSGPRDVPRCGALILFQKDAALQGGSSRNRCRLNVKLRDLRD
jgi:hypothetical protein